MSYTLSSLSRRAVLSTLGLAALGAAAPALAQASYPSKPVRLLVGYAPGGSVDAVARVAADILSKHLDGTVVVENVPGAAGVVAAQRTATSAADGYTLLLGSSNELAATKFVNPAQKYDPAKDFTPIGITGSSPVVFVAGPHVPAKTLEEALALAKAHPNKYSYGSSGVGSVLHFAGELLKQRAQVQLNHIPYRGTAALTSDLVGGTLDFGMLTPTAALPFIQSGRVVPLSVTSAARLPTLPQVPTMGETPILKGYVMEGWFGVVGPRNLPADVAQKLTRALHKGLQEPEFRKRIENTGVLPPKGNEDLNTLLQADLKKYSELVQFADMSQ